MSYALAFAPDARSQWRELEPALQELALDEMDAIAGNPPPPPLVEVVRDAVRRTPAGADYVFIRAVLDHTRRQVIVTGVVHVASAPG